MLPAKQKASLIPPPASPNASPFVRIDPRETCLSLQREAPPSHDTDNTDLGSPPKSPCVADDPLATHQSSSPERTTLPSKRALCFDRECRLDGTAPSQPKLRQWLSAPAILPISHSRCGSGSTLVGSSFPSPTTPVVPPSDVPATENKTQNESTEASQGWRASFPSEETRFHYVDPHKVSGAFQESVSSAIKVIKAAQDIEWAERVEKAVSEAKAAKDEEWTDRLAKAVAQAETAKDEEWESLDRFKESSRSNAIHDLEEDHKHEIKVLEERHAETLQELRTKHDEELQHLIQKHGAEARRLDMRRAQGAKAVKKLQEDLAEMEAEKIAAEKNLIHMTGQRDALSNAFAAMTAQFSPQAISSLEPSQREHSHDHPRGQVEYTHEITDRESRPVNKGKAPAMNKKEVSATDCRHLQSHQQSQPSQAPTVPNDLYPRLRLVETENAQLRADLEQRHEDVRYALGKADKLRALLVADSTKADTYADILMHQELIEDLQGRLKESNEAAELERLESQRLRDRIDIVTADMQNEALGRELAVKDKEAAWEQNETLLKNLKGPFDKNDFDAAFWAHYESISTQKEKLQDEIAGYKRERRGLMEEAVELQTKVAKLELSAQYKDADHDNDEFQDLNNQNLTLRVENDVLRAELDFKLAEQVNQAMEQQPMSNHLHEIQNQALDEKNREIALLKAALQDHDAPEGAEQKGDDVKRQEEEEEELDARARADYGFF